jgi:hypothetical protein
VNARVPDIIRPILGDFQQAFEALNDNVLATLGAHSPGDGHKIVDAELASGGETLAGVLGRFEPKEVTAA